jgi:putative endonuclease
MAKHNATGKRGETMAIAYFKELGYRILETNWRFARYELDIIASKNNTLHFIEVKTRTSTLYGHPELSVTPQKFKKILAAAEQYLYQNPQWLRVQYDVLSILITSGVPDFFLLEDVYL